MQTKISGTGAGTAPVVNLTFPFILQEHVKAAVSGTEVGLTWTGPTQVTFASPVPAGACWMVYRFTSPDENLVNYTDGAVLTSSDLDLEATQRLYREQELQDVADGLATEQSTHAAEFYGYSTGTLVVGQNYMVSSKAEGANGDVIYWGRSYSGPKLVGAGADNLGWSPAGYMFDLRYDDADAGSDFVRALYGRTVFGGSAASGGRIAGLFQAYHQLGPTSPSSGNRNYVGVVGEAQSDFGDGGTDISTNAKGAYFGTNSIAQLGSGAVNVFEATAAEFNTYVQTGASVRYLFGHTIVGFNSVRGSELDAALEIGGGGASNGFGPHVGWKYGIVFSDIHLADPLADDSTLLGSHWTNGGARTVASGIDLSGFIFTDRLLKGQKLGLTESQLDLDINSEGLSVVRAGGREGNGTVDAALMLQAKGLGQASLASGSKVLRVSVDDVTGITLIPTTAAAPINNGELTVEATDDTHLTFRLKGSDGVVRSTALALA